MVTSQGVKKNCQYAEFVPKTHSYYTFKTFEMGGKIILFTHTTIALYMLRYSAPKY